MGRDNDEKIEKAVDRVIYEYYHDNGTISVKCPICGGDLVYTERGNSFKISCNTEGCFHYECRGI